jgi:hypothetical protein
MYKYYRDQFTESENLLKEYETNLNKRNYFIDNLNEPLKYFNSKIEENLKSKGMDAETGHRSVKAGNNSVNSSGEVKVAVEKKGSNQGNKQRDKQGQDMQDDMHGEDNSAPKRMLNNLAPPTVKEIQIADKLENLIKNTFSKIF